MKRKLALAMVLAMTASMAQPVLAADSKTTLDVIISHRKGKSEYCSVRSSWQLYLHRTYPEGHNVFR